MQLIDDWKAVLKKAWSIRLIVLSGLFAGLEGIVQLVMAFGDLPDWMPRGWFAVLAFVTNMGAAVMRIVKQKGPIDG